MNSQTIRQQKLKQALRNREQLFAGWVSYSHPSISETFAKAGFDFIAIDMEHSTISLTEGHVLSLHVNRKGCHVYQGLFHILMTTLNHF